MNKILFTPIILLLFQSYLRAQNFCLTPPNSESSLNMMLNKKNQLNESYILRIYFHVIRRTNGTGGQSLSDVREAFDILNNDFNSHNIFFCWNNEIDFIDNDDFFDSPNTDIFSINNHDDGIDVYLFDDSLSGNGRANGVGVSTEFWVSGSYWKEPFNSLVKSHVISHEMGHVLALYHTHHGTFNEGGNDDPCPELVDGSNSSTCGDYVSDTPADPHLQFNVNQSNCIWNGSGVDSNGDFYNPDERIIMSYTDVNCMEYFSVGQGERMRNAISSYSHLQQVIEQDCELFNLTLTGPSLVCTSDTSFTLSGVPTGQTVSWSVSSNLQLVSSNATGATVRAVSSSTSGSATLTATLSNGVEVAQEVWAGRPPKPSNIFLFPHTPCTNQKVLATVQSNHKNDSSVTFNWSGVIYTPLNSNNSTIEFTTAYPLPYNDRIRVTASNACGDSFQFVKTFSVNSCGGGEGPAPLPYSVNSDEPPLLYPNPAHDVLYVNTGLLIDNVNTQVWIRISDVNGDQIISNHTDQLLEEVDVGEMKNGLYFIKLSNNQTTVTDKFIVKH